MTEDNLTSIETKMLSMITHHVLQEFQLPDIEDECHYKFKTKLRKVLDRYDNGLDYNLRFEETEEFLNCIFTVLPVSWNGEPSKNKVLEIKIPLNRIPDNFYNYRKPKGEWFLERDLEKVLSKFKN